MKRTFVMFTLAFVLAVLFTSPAEAQTTYPYNISLGAEACSPVYGGTGLVCPTIPVLWGGKTSYIGLSIPNPSDNSAVAITIHDTMDGFAGSYAGVPAWTLQYFDSNIRRTTIPFTFTQNGVIHDASLYMQWQAVYTQSRKFSGWMYYFSYGTLTVLD